MQTKIITIAAMLSLASFTSSIQAQENSPLKVGVGGTFGKPKIMPHLEKFALAQLSVTYKLTTTQMSIGKGAGKMAGARITAYLETTDGELTDADFQEVTDYFFSYFQKKLKSSGVDTVAWSKITATDFYKDGAEKSDDKDDNDKELVKVTKFANNGNSMYGGFAGFAFGKIKKASRFCDEIGAPAGFFHLIVDFADLTAGVNIKSDAPNYPSGYYPYTVTTTYKYHAATKPDVKVIPNPKQLTMLWNEKSQSETLNLEKDLESGVTYHTALVQDPSRIKNRAFAFAKAMDPVVIETTREQYKNAAKKALEKYADTFVATAKEMKKD
jgi:hypothetical protein